MNTAVWTQEEVSAALQLREDGMSIMKIARIVGHGYDATRKKLIEKLGNIKRYYGCSETCPEWCPYDECLRPEAQCSERTRWI